MSVISTGYTGYMKNGSPLVAKSVTLPYIVKDAFPYKYKIHKFAYLIYAGDNQYDLRWLMKKPSYGIIPKSSVDYDRRITFMNSTVLKNFMDGRSKLYNVSVKFKCRRPAFKSSMTKVVRVQDTDHDVIFDELKAW